MTESGRTPPPSQEVPRPFAKGRYADVRTSSDQFAEQKEQERVREKELIDRLKSARPSKMSRIWRKLIPLFQMLLALGLLGLLAWGFFWILSVAVKALDGLNSDLAVGVVAAAATVVVSVLTLVIGKYQETKAAVRQQLREKKIPIYEELISTMFKMLYAEKLGEQRMTDEELVRFFVGWTERLVVWGSDDVMKAYRAFRLHFVELAEGASDNAMKGMFLFEDLLLAIRKDLGHANQGLGRGSVLGLWLNDINNYT